MKISVIVPIYNSSNYLKKCLDSIVNQTYKNLEIILIDDNSSDDSYNICLEYKFDKRIKIIKNDVNKGVSVTRNIGIENSTGNYLTFIDSDDYVELDYIETLYNLIKEDNYDLAIVGHKKIIISQETFLFQNEKVILNQEETFKYLFDTSKNIESAVWAKLYKRELFNDIKFPENKIYEDIEVFGKVLLNTNKVIYHSVSKYNYVIRYGSLAFNSYTENEYDRIKHTKELIEKVIFKYPNLKELANLFYINNLLAVCNKQLFINVYKSDVIKLTKKIIKRNIKDILKSKINFSKKIQIILFLINIKLYKRIYKVIKNNDVMVKNEKSFNVFRLL